MRCSEPGGSVVQSSRPVRRVADLERLAAAHVMKLSRHKIALVLAVLLGGCSSGSDRNDWQIGSVFSVMHGQVDFVSPPQFEWSFGSYKSVERRSPLDRAYPRRPNRSASRF